MVGDRIDKDVIPAKLLGMKTILIRVGLHKNQQPRIPFEVPDAELDSVIGLADAILKVAEQK
jgi:ribonucleotide monophosphatase NagD (HAD superfamily)